ncbi:hypothetical protein LSAT2_029516 [Lamellibrachia satsuma]|nr:hypothetical protein LSAT2_029516 [Lamellibrachia satsuma]
MQLFIKSAYVFSYVKQYPLVRVNNDIKRAHYVGEERRLQIDSLQRMIDLRVHVKLLLIAALLTVTVGLDPDNPYIVCTRTCYIDLHICETLFKDNPGHIEVCKSYFYRCMLQCFNDLCPGTR